MSVASHPRQLALALEHPESFAREDFLSGSSNAVGLELVESWPDWPSRTMVLVGPEGCGKSHLAAMWAEESGARFVAARALTASDLPVAFATGSLVVEDAAAGQSEELALFHLLNLAREEDAFVLITARTPPAGWSVGLRDLSSRLKALPVVTISPPDDAILRAVLVKLFADRQLAVEESLVSYVVMHIERSFAAARRVAARLDQEALRQKRPLTRALAAEILRGGEP
jgi:chromosomal replication initiation ATPase DnaA